jgi:hypothetical protein
MEHSQCADFAEFVRLDRKGIWLLKSNALMRTPNATQHHQDASGCKMQAQQKESDR